MLVKKLLFLSYLQLLSDSVWSTDIVSVNKSSKTDLNFLHRRSEKGDDKKFDYHKSARHIIRSKEKKLKEPKPIPDNATPSRKGVYQKTLNNYQRKRAELERYK